MKDKEWELISRKFINYKKIKMNKIKLNHNGVDLLLWTTIPVTEYIDVLIEWYVESETHTSESLCEYVNNNTNFKAFTNDEYIDNGKPLYLGVQNN